MTKAILFVVLFLFGCAAVVVAESVEPPLAPAVDASLSVDAYAPDAYDAADARDAGSVVDASPGISCRECGEDTWSCADACTAEGGFITGDGRPYHCCWWVKR